MLKGSAEGFGFMHESYYRDDSRRFTRAWFAWANTLFGELVGTLAASRPGLLRASVTSFFAKKILVDATGHFCAFCCCF
jgi:hypothetical protein